MFHSLTRRLIHLHLKVAGSTPASGFSFCVVCFMFLEVGRWLGRVKGHVIGFGRHHQGRNNHNHARLNENANDKLTIMKLVL
jgi:hypothetical protein